MRDLTSRELQRKRLRGRESVPRSGKATTSKNRSIEQERAIATKSARTTAKKAYARNAAGRASASTTA
jgi:hypothetical protein